MRCINAKLLTLIIQFAQYVGVGGVAFAVDFALLVGLTELLGINYLVSATLSFLAGLAVNYSLCIYFVFEERALASQIYEFIAFGLVGIGGLALNLGIMSFITDYLGIRYTIAKLVAAVFVLLFNFTLRRQLLFSANSPAIGWMRSLSASLAARRQ